MSYVNLLKNKIMSKISFENYKPWLPSILLFPVCLFLVFNKGQFIPILDHVNLLFHEGGHGIFKIFGGVIYTLGGSLMQVIIPGLFIYYFWYHKKRIGLQISVIYLAENLMNVSVYIADARARSLPLLGGNKVYHDWHYLLREFGILEYDAAVGNLVFIVGIIILIFALVLPAMMRDYVTVKLDLKM